MFFEVYKRAGIALEMKYYIENNRNNINVYVNDGEVGYFFWYAKYNKDSISNEFIVAPEQIPNFALRFRPTTVRRLHKMLAIIGDEKFKNTIRKALAKA